MTTLSQRRAEPVPETVEKRVRSVYPSPEARSKLMAIYDAKLARWPVAFDERDVVTRYGRTHVVSSGRPEAPPLVLLHAAGVAAFMWRSVIGPLSERYRTHALDTIGDAGKSLLLDPAKHPRKGEEYSAWLGDVFAGLEIEAANVVASSMGGWIALNYAADFPGRVTRLCLLGPMGLPSWPVTLRVLLRLMSATVLPSQSKKERLVSWAVGDDAVVRAEIGDWMAAVLDSGCAPKLGNPLPVPARKLRAIRAPTLVVLGGRDGPVGDADKVATRAKRYIRTVDVEVLPDNGHAMSVEAPEHVARRILAFLD